MHGIEDRLLYDMDIARQNGISLQDIISDLTVPGQYLCECIFTNYKCCQLLKLYSPLSKCVLMMVAYFLMELYMHL
jgi:hypothetical protein